MTCQYGVMEESIPHFRILRHTPANIVWKGPPHFIDSSRNKAQQNVCVRFTIPCFWFPDVSLQNSQSVRYSRKVKKDAGNDSNGPTCTVIKITAQPGSLGFEKQFGRG